MPSTLKGWAILVIILAILLFGFAGAGTWLGHAVHEMLTGIHNFASSVRGG